MVAQAVHVSTTPWSGYIDPCFLYLGTGCRWVVSFTSRPLYPRGKSPRYLLDRRLGGPQNQSERHAEVKILDPHRDSNSDPSVVQPIASRYTDWAIPAHPKAQYRVEKRERHPELVHMSTAYFSNINCNTTLPPFLGLPSNLFPSGFVTKVISFHFLPNSAVGIATGYGLDGRGVRVRVPVTQTCDSTFFVVMG
jgi:hypothetical protein